MTPCMGGERRESHVGDGDESAAGKNGDVYAKRGVVLKEKKEKSGPSRSFEKAYAKGRVGFSSGSGGKRGVKKEV